MSCNLNTNINNLYFCKKDKNAGAQGSHVYSPPDKMPAYSTYDVVYKNGPMKYEKKSGGKKLNAGKLSMILTFSSMTLAFLACLPFIRKR